MHVRPLPWQGFPGIFSSIDRYTKQVILRHLGRDGRLPGWMSPIGLVAGHIDPPHWSKFQAMDQATGVTLRGEADAIFRLADDSCAIVDYKTSRYNPDNRSQHRVYRAQLNAYGWIARSLDFPPVSGLALVYMEPATDNDTIAGASLINVEGFALGFRPRVVEVELDPDRLLPPLMRRAVRIHETTEPPESRDGCRDCAALEGLLRVLGKLPIDTPVL